MQTLQVLQLNERVKRSWLRKYEGPAGDGGVYHNCHFVLNSLFDGERANFGWSLSQNIAKRKTNLRLLRALSNEQI